MFLLLHSTHNSLFLLHCATRMDALLSAEGQLTWEWCFCIEVWFVFQQLWICLFAIELKYKKTYWSTKGMTQGYPWKGCIFIKEVTAYIILQCYGCSSALAHTHHCLNTYVYLGKMLDTFSYLNSARLEMAKLVLLAHNISSKLWRCNKNFNHSGHKRLPLDTILLHNVSPTFIYIFSPHVPSVLKIVTFKLVPFFFISIIYICSAYCSLINLSTPATLHVLNKLPSYVSRIWCMKNTLVFVTTTIPYSENMNNLGICTSYTY